MHVGLVSRSDIRHTPCADARAHCASDVSRSVADLCKMTDKNPVGRLVRLTKKSPYYKLNKSDWVVVVAYSSTVSEGGGRRGVQTVTEKTTLYGTGVEGDARIVQRFVLKPPSTSDVARGSCQGVPERSDGEPE